jgi:hypothetical protein
MYLKPTIIQTLWIVVVGINIIAQNVIIKTQENTLEGIKLNIKN